jgi:hypothetical protein
MHVSTRIKPTKREQRPLQRDVLRAVMLSAAECETWLTLRELSLLTRIGEASISAQLRHLRKERFGGFVVEKRCRQAAEIVGRQGGPLWEYRLSHGLRRSDRFAQQPVSRGGRLRD